MFKKHVEFCYHFRFILFMFDVLCHSFSSVFPVYSSLTSFMFEIKQLYGSCEQILVFCDRFPFILSVMNLVSHSFSSTCPSYSSQTSFMCVRKKLKDFQSSCMQALVICYHSQLICLNLIFYVVFSAVCFQPIAV